MWIQNSCNFFEELKSMVKDHSVCFGFKISWCDKPEIHYLDQDDMKITEICVLLPPKCRD